MDHMAIKLDRASGSCWRGIFGPRFRLLISATAVLLTPIGLGIAPMSIVVMAQQSQLPSCDLKSVNWDNCRGSRQYTDGVYVGEFRGNEFDGSGTLTYLNGTKYVGEFRNGAVNGQGTFTAPDGTKYVGEFKDNTFDGQGSLTYLDGTKYVGEFKDNKFQGTFTSPDGTKYAGEFRDGRLNGHGASTYPDGREYVGEFRDNKFNGQGTLTYPTGGKYVGEFKDDQANGKGTSTYPDGAKYVGEFRNGAFNGQGTLTYANGRKYIGEFRDNKFEGQGTLTYAAGSSIGLSGIWADGEFVGTSQELVAMEKENGVYVVPVRFNGAITLNAIIDSGASDVSVPADIVSTLIRTKTVSDEDFLGVQTYVLADGTKVPSPRFRIRSLKVGNKTLENVTASIASGNADILLGQSFLGRFKSWSVDNDRHLLILR